MLDFDQVKDAVAESLAGAKRAPGRPPSNTDKLYKKLLIAPEIADADPGLLKRLVDACGFDGHATDTAFDCYIKTLRSFMDKEVSARRGAPAVPGRPLPRCSR